MNLYYLYGSTTPSAYMNNRILLLLITIVLSFGSITYSSAQTSVNYNVSTNTTASLQADKYGNAISFSAAPNLVPNSAGAVNSSLSAIGFDLVFMGRYYTHFIAGSNGAIALGLSNSPAGMFTASGANDLTRTVGYPPTTANNAAVLAPFWGVWRTDVRVQRYKKPLPAFILTDVLLCNGM